MRGTLQPYLPGPFPRLLLGGALLGALSCSGPPPSEAGDHRAGPSDGTAAAEGVATMNAVSLQFIDYRNDPEELAGRVDAMLSEAPPPRRREAPVGIVVPHAGYIYSGPVAAYAYRAVQGQDYDTVVVVGLSHREAFQGISVLDAESFQSPLGTIPCDREMIASMLQAHRAITYRPEAHENEHSLEVQIPFLQRSLKDFSIVLAVVGSRDAGAEEALAALLAREAAGKKILMVASSDFSHYYPYDLANRMDRVALHSVLALDSEGLKRDIRARKCEMCGLRPVQTVVAAARRMGVRKGELLRQANSGDTAGPRDRVVGYAAVAFYDEEAADRPDRMREQASSSLDSASRKELLAIARGAIEGVLRDGRAPEPRSDNPALQAPRGAFVTIKIDGRLRGCIGNFGIRNAKALFRTVSEMAVAAAVQDPRFPPLTEDELPKIELEISALSPLRPVSDAGDVEVGRHGLYITKGGRSGVLLPQVATEYGWDRTTFLEQTCRKAGLGPGEWKEGAVISVFEAEVFGEN
jgi:AmmeMemoRadiSam system protein B/AmmeMemoRadiSam system protein A